VTTFTLGVEYVEEQCCHDGCGISFAMTRDFNRRMRNSHDWWYCPQGHKQHYTGASDEQKLRDSQAREVALKDQLAAAIRESESTRAALLRDRARFAAGVCPCCSRSFENVRRHMVSQHPDYDVTRIEKHAPVFKCSCGRKFDTYRGLRSHQGHSRRSTGTYAWDAPGQSRYSAHLTEVKV
jgi:hypothetical protein